MKKHILFTLLFALIFAFPASAVPDLSECETLEEAYEMGYADALNEEYEAAISNTDESDPMRYTLYGAIHKLYEDNAFIEYAEYDLSQIDEYDIAGAYGDGYSAAGGDFAAFRATLDSEPESEDESYSKGYKQGLEDGQRQNRAENEELQSSEYKISVNNPGILFATGIFGIFAGILIGYFAEHRKAEPKRTQQPIKVETANATTQKKPSSRYKAPLVKPPVIPASAKLLQEDLDEYIRREKTEWEIGLAYERYIGYIYEMAGYTVEYTGAIKGRKDMGCDLTAKKDGKTLIIQCKRWRHTSYVRENYVMQLHGTVSLYREGHPGAEVEGILLTTANFSPEAQTAAAHLGIRLKHKAHLQHPLIKCYTKADGQKVYTLPMEYGYDRIHFSLIRGDKYAKSVQEAESWGFTSTLD